MSLPIRNTSLKRGFTWSLAGNLAGIASQFGFLIAITKMGTPTMAGQYGLAMALVAPILALSNLQLRGLQGTDGRNEFLFSEYLGLRITTLLLAIPIIAGNVTISAGSFTVAVVALLISVRLGLNAISDVYFGLFQQHEWMSSIAKANIVTSLLSFVTFAVGLWATRNLAIAAMLSVLATFLPLVLHNIPTARHLAGSPAVSGRLRPTFDRTRIWPLLQQAIPLGIVSFIISLNANIPRYFLARTEGLHQLGIFFSLVSLLIASDTLAAAMAQTTSPRLARLFAEDRRQDFIALLTKLELMALGLGALAVCAALMAGSQVVSLIYSPEYGGYRGAIILLAVSACLSLMSRFVGNAITVGRRLRSQIVTNVVCLAALIASCFIFVPAHGVTGAAAAVAITSLLRLVFNTRILFGFLAEWDAETQPRSASQSIGEGSIA